MQQQVQKESLMKIKKQLQKKRKGSSNQKTIVADGIITADGVTADEDKLFRKYFAVHRKVIPQKLIDEFLKTADSSFPSQRNKVKLYGKECTVPRDQLFRSKNGKSYTYSRQVLPNGGWREIDQQFCNLANKLGNTNKFNCVLINGYNGGDSVGWHADDEKNIDQTQPIVSMSMGETRAFHIKLKSSTKMMWKVYLNNGDVVVMKPGAQKLFHHQVPKTTRKGVKRRWNLTFRVYKQE